MKESIRAAILATGAVAVGFSRAENVEENAMEMFRQWISDGGHAGMDYLVRHTGLKQHPHNVLEDVASVISIAYSYAPREWRSSELPVIAAYAYGDDYHDVLRSRLSPVVSSLKAEYGCNWRICIDSAPIAERYWAVRSGIGKRAMNGSVIVDGHGSMVFLVEILTSLPIEPDTAYTSDCSEASEISCGSCGRCVAACPQKALRPDGTVDSRRCINYLTIEHRGDWEGEELQAMQTPASRRSLYGCDICLRVCPHNRDIPPTSIKEFHPRKGIIKPVQPADNTREVINCGELLTRERILAMTPEEFSGIFKGSPIKRARLDGLQRNAQNLERQKPL